MNIIFWILIALVIYCYFGYPAALGLLAGMKKKKFEKTRASVYPSVSVVLAVWNEEDVIGRKIRNLLSLNYPVDKIEIFIGCDGSTDKTVKIIKEFNDSRIHLFENRDRKGKIFIINELMKRVSSEMVVFTDARQCFAGNTIKELVLNFTDPRVGCVSGELMFSGIEGSTSKGVNLYWDYEKFIRSREGEIHSTLGATGAVYAIRRELFTACPEDVVLDDMYIPLKIIQKGYRVIFDDAARAYDKVADNPREEYRRKARTLYGNYQMFKIFSGLFNPFKSPVAIQFFSHKLLRVVMPFIIMSIFFINLFLLEEAGYYILFLLQVIFYIMAFLGGLTRYSSRGFLKFVSNSCYAPYVFCLLNFSAVIGFLRFASSGQEVTWKKARE